MIGEDVLSKSEVSSDKLESGALELRSLSIGYDEPLISGINLRINPGETVAILGPSGIGKTTLLRTIAGLIVPLSGDVVHDFPKRSGIGYIPQRLGLVKHSTVRSNVAVGARTRKPRWFPAILPLGSDLNSDVNSALISLGIEVFSKYPVRILSGGQQRRVAIARALVQRPKLILADEFLGELDKDNVKSIIAATKSLISEIGATLIMVEHQEERAIEIADKIWRIVDGKVIEEMVK
ncbi:MAG: ATP-binding cassette domain-containing protein [Candidatus Thermoplasmatota archaeon]|nr:ATP-binding cassette domain-containing protein [Candidatus Thermoplasmatota archaeon]